MHDERSATLAARLNMRLRGRWRAVAVAFNAARLPSAELVAGQLSMLAVRITSIIFLLMGFVSFFGCSQPKPKGVAISEQAFSATLPGEWSRRSEEGGSRIVFSSSNNREQLTVSLIPSSEPMKPNQQLSTFNRVLELRQQAERHGLPASAVTMTQPTVSNQCGTHVGNYNGFEAQRRFACLLLCSRSLVATFYYEAIGLTQDEAEERASKIFASVKLTQ